MRRRGFTLIELLVVVGIIAVLIAILIPSLSKAKAAGRTAVCLAHERGMGQALQTYYAEFSPKMLSHLDPKAETIYPFEWVYMLFARGMSAKDYLSNSSSTMVGNKVIVCPETEPQPPNIHRLGLSGTAHMQWAYNRSGSYAINQWLYDLGAGPRSYRDPASSQRGSIIPVFLDGTTMFANSAEQMPVPSNLEDPVSSATINSISGDCMNRHNMAINVSFFDGHAETVKLPNLWTLRWSADWTRTDPAVVPGMAR